MEDIIKLFDGDINRVNEPIPYNTIISVTPLCSMIYNKIPYNDIKKFIRQYKPEINNYITGFNAINAAIETNNVKLMQLLIKNGGNVNLIYEFPSSPLHFACKTGNIPMIKLLIKHSANIDFKNYCGKKPIDYLTLSQKIQLGIMDTIIVNEEEYLIY